MRSFLRALRDDESGQATVEYALAIGFVVLGVFAVIVAFRTQLEALWTAVTASLTNAQTNVPK
jgi:Flp pilus assembly pilin Flp